MSKSSGAEPALLGPNVTTGHDITDRCMNAVESEDEKKAKEDTDTKESCCSEWCKKIRNMQDPVQGSHCSVGRLGFFLLFVCGVVFVVLELLSNDDWTDYSDWVELIAAAFVGLMALFVSIFIGGDLFMFEAFKKVVNTLGQQVAELKAHRIFLQNKLTELGAVSNGMESVYKQMNGDVTATANLLTDMERFGKLQTVAAVMNNFFAADYNGSGDIRGEEADLLFDQIIFLWELVPGFDRSKVVEHVRTNGLTIAQLSLILDALVVEDQSACTKALEALCAQTADTDAAIKPAPVLSETAAHSSAPCESLEDLEAQKFAPCMQQDVWHGAAPPDDTDDEAMKPLFTVPTPLPTMNLGPVTMGGRVSVWGTWHLLALICVPINTTFLVLVILALSIHHIILQTVGVCLALGLTGAGKLIEVLRQLRREAKEFRVENDSLEIDNKELASTVSKLQKLKLGFDHLQQKCGGNVEKAKELLHKSETKIKMEAMAFVTRLFRSADANRDMKLEGEEKEKFFASLEQVLHKLPGFDISVIKKFGAEGEVTQKQIKEIIDAVASIDHSEKPQVVN